MQIMRVYIAVCLCVMLTMSVRLRAEEANPDSAWLSLEADGYPVLTELEVEKGDTVVLHFMMKNMLILVHHLPQSRSQSVLHSSD